MFIDSEPFLRVTGNLLQRVHQKDHQQCAFPFDWIFVKVSERTFHTLDLVSKRWIIDEVYERILYPTLQSMFASCKPIESLKDDLIDTKKQECKLIPNLVVSNFAIRFFPS